MPREPYDFTDKCSGLFAGADIEKAAIAEILMTATLQSPTCATAAYNEDPHGYSRAAVPFV